MRRNFLCASAAVVLFAFGVVLGQPLIGESLNVTPIASGSASLQPSAQRLVITNDTDYASFFGGTPPSSPTVNFSTEDVLAVAMGTQPAGSSINITGVDVRTTGFTAGWGMVHVSSVIGSGGTGGPITINGGTITSTGGSTLNAGGTTVNVGGTFTLGTSTGLGGTLLVYTISGGTTTITGGTTTTTGGTTTATTSAQTITNTGGSTVTSGGTTTTSGTVIVTISVSTPPSSLPPLTIVGGTTTTTANISTTGGTTTISGGTTTGGGGSSVQPYSVVKVNKGALAYAFLNDVTPSTYSGPTPFSALSYTTSGGSAPFVDAISIDGSGNVTVNRSIGGTGGTTYVGTLSSIENLTLNTAFVNANPATLPGTIVDPTLSTLTGIPSETLSSTTSAGTYSSVITRAGFYNGSSTLASLVDAIRGPAERIVRGTLTQSYQGHVHFVGSDLKVSGNTIDPTDPFYNLIASANGNNVDFDGVGKPHASAVMDVVGKVTIDQPLLNFPSAGSDVISTLPAGTAIDVTNLTLSGTYLEVTSSGQRGFVLASAVSIIR